MKASRKASRKARKASRKARKAIKNKSTPASYLTLPPLSYKERGNVKTTYAFCSLGTRLGAFGVRRRKPHPGIAEAVAVTSAAK